jgi:hypothetical protein
MSKENFGLKGRVNIKLIDSEGNIKHEQDVNNLVTAAGRSYVANRLNTTPTVMSFTGIGTGTTAPTLNDVALETQLSTRLAITRTIVTVDTANDTIQHVTTFPVESHTGMITEAGLFSASTAGTMMSRVVFTAVDKTPSDALVVTWRITVV